MFTFFFLIFTEIVFSNYSKTVNSQSDVYTVPKIVWLYWEGNMTGILKYLLHHLKQNLEDYKIIFLNRNTIRDYFNTNEIAQNLDSYPRAVEADYYRFLLLAQYGGIWLDASSYVKNGSVFDELLNEMYEKKAELLAFNYAYHPLNNIEISMLFCPKKSNFMNQVLYLFDFGLKNGRLELMKKMIKEGLVLNAPHQYKKDDGQGKEFFGEYYFASYCIQYVLQIYNKGSANIIIKKAEEWSFKYQEDCKWKGRLMNKKWNERNFLNEYNLIKFTGSNRAAIKESYDDVI